MTIAPSPTRAIYQGTPAGTNGPFPLATTGGTPIPINDISEIVAVKYPAAGGRMVLSQAGSPPDYLIGLAPVSDGSVTYQSAYINTVAQLFTGDILVIERQTAIQQAFSPAQAGPLFHASMEGAWDKLTRIAQEHADLLARAVIANDTWDGITLNGAPRLDALGLRLGNLQAAINPDEAVVLAQLGVNGSAGQAAAALAVSVQDITPTGQPMTIDLNQGYYIQLHLDTTIPSIAFVNWAPAGQATKITMEIRQGGSNGITSWPGEINWNGGQVPIINGTLGAVNLVTILSSDQGVTALGSSW